MSELLYLLVWLKLQCLGDCDVKLGPGDCRLLWAGLTPVSLCMVREPDWTHVYMLAWTPVSWSPKQEAGSEARADLQGSCRLDPEDSGTAGWWELIWESLLFSISILKSLGSSEPLLWPWGGGLHILPGLVLVLFRLERPGEQWWGNLSYLFPLHGPCFSLLSPS